MTDLTSVSTFGWYSDATVTDRLTPISTFGWWLDAIVSAGEPEVIAMALMVYTIYSMELQR